MFIVKVLNTQFINLQPCYRVESQVIKKWFMLWLYEVAFNFWVREKVEVVDNFLGTYSICALGKSLKEGDI